MILIEVFELLISRSFSVKTALLPFVVPIARTASAIVSDARATMLLIQPSGGKRSAAQTFRRSSVRFVSNIGKNAPVLIVGAGIGGLCLAQGLKKHGIPCKVFERDPSATARLQGYRLRINNDGYDALEANLPADLLELYLQSNAAFEPGIAILDALTGEKAAPKAHHLKFPVAADGGDAARGPPPPPPAGAGNPAHVFASDRTALRAALAAKLTPDELRFGRTFKKFSLLSDGVEIEFESGQVERGSLLVGGDGINSRVRRQLLPGKTRLLDTDGRALYGKTPLTPEFEAAFAQAALAKTTLVTDRDPHISLFTEPMRFSPASRKFTAAHGHALPPDYLYWVLVARSGILKASGEATPKQLQDLSLRVTSHWSSSLREVFAHQQLEFTALVKISTLEPQYKPWPSSRVTLIGDAIHAMPPAGVGANTALRDARVLAQSLVENGVGVDAIAAYEAQMRDYAIDAITSSLDAGEKLFGQPPLASMKPID